jgi:hypothetical protein
MITARPEAPEVRANVSPLAIHGATELRRPESMNAVEKGDKGDDDK